MEGIVKNIWGDNDWNFSSIKKQKCVFSIKYGVPSRVNNSKFILWRYNDFEQWNFKKLAMMYPGNEKIQSFIFIGSVAQSCPTLCDPMDWLQHSRLPSPSPAPRACSLMSIESVMPSTHLVLSSPSPAFNPSQHQGLFKCSSHQVAKVLELQLQHQAFQWIFRIDFLQDWFVRSPCCPRDSQESPPTPHFKSPDNDALIQVLQDNSKNIPQIQSLISS